MGANNHFLLHEDQGRETDSAVRASTKNRRGLVLLTGSTSVSYSDLRVLLSCAIAANDNEFAAETRARMARMEAEAVGH